MPISPQAAKPSRRTRRMGPSCRGGASSVLRLAPPALPRWGAGSTAAAVASWIERAAVAALPSGDPADWPVSETHGSIISRLLPSHERGLVR